MRDLKLLKQMKEEYGITFSDNPCYYIDNNIITGDREALSQIPIANKYSDVVIYENVNHLSEYVNLLGSYYRECNTKKYISKMFRTTFSIKIGETNNLSGEKLQTDHQDNYKEPMNSNFKLQYEDIQTEEGIMESLIEINEDSIEMDNEIEESNFKSSFAKDLADSYQQSNAPSQPSFVLQSYDNDTTSGAKINYKKKYEDMLLQIKELFEKLSQREEDLAKATNEILTLKLESARLKAENRSMRAAESVINSPISINQIDKLPISCSEADTWTLQQKVIHLSNQLDKAELTKHAYESATVQLVAFIKTIASTLAPMTNEERVSETNNVPNTVNMLTDIENTIKNNKFDYSRERSFVRMNNLKNSVHSNAPPDPKAKPKRHKLANSFTSNSSGNSVKKEDRRWNRKSPKAKLKKSGSVSDIPWEDNIPQVTRTLSADDINECNKIRKKPHKIETVAPLKNKRFFSSLKNVFKIEAERPMENCSKPKKKKKNFLSFSRRKRNPSPVRSEGSSQSFQSSTFCVGYHNGRDEPGSAVADGPDSLPTHVETDASAGFDVLDSDRPASEMLSGPREMSVTLSMMDLSLADITSPSGYVAGKDEDVEIARGSHQPEGETC